MRVVGVLAIGVLWASAVFAAGEPAPQVRTFYDADPRHLWNRLDDALFTRVAPDNGERFGSTELDILFWDSTRHLLTSPTREKSIEVLDEFIRARGERRVRDPLKRAWLQRELWALFDWSARPRNATPGSPELLARMELQRRLATVIARVALTPEEIAGLPDNGADAELRLRAAGFPQQMSDPEGAWLLVGRSDDPTAREHAASFGGRSTFLVYVKLPEGRAQALQYLKQLREFRPALVYSDQRVAGMAAMQDRNHLRTNPESPQFPAGTQWALVRRMNLIDTQGNIRATRLTESVQTRRYDVVPDEDGDFNALSTAQSRAEFQLDRRNLPALRAVESGERDFQFVHFRSMGVDPFERATAESWARDRNRLRGETLRTCGQCHFARGILSVNTYTGFGMTAVELDASTVDREAEATIAWKQRQFAWGLMKGLWEKR